MRSVTSASLLLLAALAMACSRAGFDPFFSLSGDAASPDASDLTVRSDLDPSDMDLTDGPSWWDERWRRRRKITIHASMVAADLSAFPVLITLQDASLAAGEAALRFVSVDDEQVLAHEVDRIDSPAGDLWCWVAVPDLSASKDTVLYLYYDNPDAVPPTEAAVQSTWDSHAMAVWHMSSSAGASVSDSSAHGNHLTAFGDMSAADQVAGKVGRAIHFDGTDDRLTAEPSASLAVSNAMTLSAWARVERWQVDSGTIIAKATTYGSANLDYLLRAEAGYLELHFFAEQLHTTDFSGWSDAGVWHNLVGTYDGQLLTVYFDGEPVSRSEQHGSIRVSDRPLHVGSFGTADPGRTWSGEIDEVRIDNVARSEAWIATAYANQADPGGFSTVGPVETWR